MKKAPEKYLTVHDARTLFSTKPSKSTIHKWIRQGVVNRRTGERVYLGPTVMEGGKLTIPESAITKFKSACN